MSIIELPRSKEHILQDKMRRTTLAQIKAKEYENSRKSQPDLKIVHHEMPLYEPIICRAADIRRQS